VTLLYGDNVQRSSRPAIVIRPCSASAGRALVDRTPSTLDWLPASGVVPEGTVLPFQDPIPILFWSEGAELGEMPFGSKRSEDTIELHVDIIAATIFLLSRWEETVVDERDEHGRFPGSASVAQKQGFLDRPVVDEYGLILAEWLRILLPGWEPESRTFSVKLSHDVDHVRQFTTARSALRAVGGHLLKRRSPRLAWKAGANAIQERVTPEQAPNFLGIGRLAEIAQDFGLGRDAFYFMATKPTPIENDYHLCSPMIRQAIEDLRGQGFEIGLHAGYHTLGAPDRLMEEKAKLDAILGTASYGGRQHYLRFRVPHTWRHWEQVGLSYDSTLAFADHEGFRCGTCHPYRPFDLEQDREIDLWELPLLVMEQTLSQHRGLSPADGEAAILALAQRCQLVGGTFTLLWHNSSLVDDWQPWAAIYTRVLRLLAEMSPSLPHDAGGDGSSSQSGRARGLHQ
jgi:hypothetical protein